MRKLLSLLSLSFLLAASTGCPKTEQNARDTAAALKGLITSAQVQYQASCTANSTQTVCQTINRGVAAENALITATELYCSWATSGPPTNPDAACIPVASMKAGLESALANANQLINELKATVKPQ